MYHTIMTTTDLSINYRNTNDKYSKLVLYIRTPSSSLQVSYTCITQGWLIFRTIWFRLQFWKNFRRAFIQKISFDLRNMYSFFSKITNSKRTVWLFSPGTPVSSTNKADRRDIAKILFKVALNIINHQTTTKKEILFHSLLGTGHKTIFNRYVICNITSIDIDAAFHK